MFVRGLSMLSLFISSKSVQNRFIVTAWTASKCSIQSFQNRGTQKLSQRRADTNENLETLVPRKFVPFPFRYHQIVEARVETLTNLGFGICRVPLPTDLTVTPADATSVSKGWVIMVPNVIPGELILARIYRNHGKYSDADLIQVIETHPKRVTPKCKLALDCGGCQYQHMDISLQREWKTAQVQELFERVGKFPKGSIPSVLPTLGTEHIYHYRSKITPHYDAPERNRSKEMEALGFQKKNNRQILDVTNCDIATHAINQKLQEIRQEIFTAAKEKTLKKPKKGATLLLRDAWALDATHDMDLSQHIVETNPNVYVKTKVKDLVFRFLAGNFFQNNPFILHLMVDRVVDASIALNAQGKRMTHLIDCYCGSGLFCLSAASKFDVCVGIEVNDRAIDEARVNAQLNHIDNCKFIAASAEAIFESTDPVVLSPLDSSLDLNKQRNVYVKDFPRETTVVILDPPRKGCSPEFLEQMFVFQPQRIVYMSCDPATQARDAESIAAHGYQILRILPLDVFPQTRQLSMLII